MGRHNKREEVYKIRFRNNGKIKTSIVTVESRNRLDSIAHSYSNIIGIAKAHRDYDRMTISELKDLSNNLMKDIAQPKMTPLAMDEFIWLRRNKRIENKDRDKKDA